MTRIIEHLPFGDGAFNVVTACNSVLYAADPRRALAEIARGPPLQAAPS